MSNAKDPETTVFAATPESAAKKCAHAKVEIVGFDAATRFMRCVACGEILVSQGTQLWQIRPIPVRGV